MVSTTDEDRTEKLGITLPISLLRQIENKRGDIPRSMYIRRAIESYLKGSVRSERWPVMFDFIKKLKPVYEIPEPLSVREQALKVFSRIEGLDDIKKL